MSLKEIIQLKDKKVVYVLEENDSTYIYRKQKVTGYTLTLVCRKRKCEKTFSNSPNQQIEVFEFYVCLSLIKFGIRYDID